MQTFCAVKPLVIRATIAATSWYFYHCFCSCLFVVLNASRNVKLLISSWKFFLMQSFNWCCFCCCEWQKLKKHPLISYLLFYCKKLNVTACTLLAHKPFFSLNNLQMLYYGHFSSRVCGPILAPFSFIFCLSNKQFCVYKKMWKCFSGKIWTHDLLTESLLT